MFDIDVEFTNLMNGILYRHLKNKTTHNEIASFGFDYSKWPDCSAKTAVNDFYEALPKGYDYAKAVTIEAHRGYLQTINDRSMPKSVDLVGEKLQGFIKKYWQQKFAREIQLNPENLDSLIEEYQTNKPTGVRLFSLDEQISGIVKRQLEKVNAGSSMVVIPGFEKLSDYIGGWNPKCITILAAKSGFGKTNFSVSLAQRASEIMPVLYFNMEMDEDNFSSRFIHNGAEIDNKSWRKGDFVTSVSATDRILAYTDQVKAKKPIRYSNGKALSLGEIRTAIFSMFDGSEMGFVVVDYDQKIRLAGKKDEWMEMRDAISELEEVAKATNTHVLVLAQADEDGHVKSSKRAEQGASNVLHFSKVENAFTANADRYYIKGSKTRYSGDMCVEVEVDLAKSIVREIGFMEPPKKKKGANVF